VDPEGDRQLIMFMAHEDTRVFLPSDGHEP
jgi:hypothetical protein